MEKVLRKNSKPITVKNWISFLAMLAPGILFVGGLYFLAQLDPRYDWFFHLERAPWQFWMIGLCGTIATIGGVGDWVFHRVYVAVGPREHKSHLLALITGGLPLFFCMAIASVVEQPVVMLIPVVVIALYTCSLICYDEFVFHRKRCKALETTFHRLLVFGNSFAWLAWFHWCFVRPILNIGG